VAVKIRLKRMGKIRAPFYRIVVADSRTKRDGRVIEEIGTYNPKTEPSTINVNSERAQYWLGVGAQPTESVAAILKITGDIGGKATLKQPEPKADATTKKAAAKKADKKADEAPAEPAAEETPAEETPAEETPADDKPAEA